MKKALITGITGQDGAYLAKFLIDKGYQVHGIKRRSSSFNTSRIDHLYQDINAQGTKSLILHYGDMTDATNLIRIIQEIKPDELYNLAAQSHVRVSFDTPEYTANADGIGTLRLLEALRIVGLASTTRFYQASSSELYGNAAAPQNEQTSFAPCSPYGVAKLYAYWITVNYRQAYNMFACNGILFNHESPYRGETFVTRKITRALARIAAGSTECLYLGNLEARRDWGYAPDYIQAMWLMLQQEHPDDFVIATGKVHSVREFVEAACAYAGISLAWQGQGLHQKGINSATGSTIIAINPTYFRPTEVHYLQGDASKAHELLGWQPTVSFEMLVEIMMRYDMDALKQTTPISSAHTTPRMQYAE